MQATDSFRLNQDLIKNCNAESDFNAGDIIAAEAENTYKGFKNMIKSFGTLNKRQIDYAKTRQAEWKKLVEQLYNNELSRRTKIIPLNIKLKHKISNGELNKFIADSVITIKALAKKEEL